jgi:hypothetical protein
MLRIVQLQRATERRVALVDEPRLRFIDGFNSVYALATAAIQRNEPLSSLITHHLADASLEYDAVYEQRSDWHLLLPFDHPEGGHKTLVSGTGLTHFGSARDRNAMHVKASPDADENLTDSMKMFRWGVEGGHPPAGQIGIAPEWFFKGNGNILRACNEPLDVPQYAEDGGEEAEIAGCYLIAADGTPIRVGMATGNEFSDHRFEKRNYLNLAGSKLRTCSIGPELVIDPTFVSIPGEVHIDRAGKTIWSKSIRTGQAEMCHTLANLEHHHFKFDLHRNPGDVHIHYFGAHSLSFGEGVQLLDGDVMLIHWDGFGRPLRNIVRIAPKSPLGPIPVIPLR